MAKYRIKKSQIIGSPDAETDDALFDVFVENETLKEILDTKSQSSILLGRTGSGKSAIIRYIEKNCTEIKRINPEAMSLQFLSNSTILQYFKSIDINLNLFYKVLWKHVFIVELLKLYFKDDFNKTKQNRWIEELKHSFLKKIGKIDPNKQKAIDYLNSWTDRFWLDTEYRIKELEKTIDKKFKAGIGVEADPVTGRIDFEKISASKSITEIKYKAESIIHETQSKELIEIFNMMRDDLFKDHQKKFYLLIDDLDKEWIDDSFRYDLIGAMVEVVKDMRQFKGVKIVITLRENLNELLKLGMKHQGGQREKFKPLYANMIWEYKDLQDLIDKRLLNISENTLNLRDAFYIIRKTNQNGFDYVLNRTYMRPRDVISYVNHAISNSNSKTHFSKDIIHKAEITYSVDRFQALEDEWRENYGEINLISKFLNGIFNGFKLKSVNEISFAELYIEEHPDRIFKGILLEVVISWQSDKIKYGVFLKRIIYLLYHIGILGIKKGPTQKVSYYYDSTLITRDDISNNNRYYVHPSLYSYFKVNTIEQLPEDKD